MATVVVNKPDCIKFSNVSSADKTDADYPTVMLQTGQWDAGSYTETGIVVDVYGLYLPILSPQDARKLAKWLTRAADELDGNKSVKRRKPHYESDEDDFNAHY